MKKVAKAIIDSSLASLMQPPILRRLGRGSLSILMYHGVIDRPMQLPDPCMLPVDAFRAQMSYLARNFRVVGLSTAADLLRNGQLNEPRVVITFDDGYQNNLDVALPILRELNLPAVIFVSTSFIGTDRTVWTGELQTAFETSQRSQFEWDGSRYDLGTVGNRLLALNRVKAILKSRPHDQLADDVAQIVNLLGDHKNPALPTDSPYRILSPGAITELVDSALIELGAHTHSHYILSRLPHARQFEEIKKSIDVVSDLSGRRCELFAYPNGRKQDYNGETIEILEELGITTAVTTEPGLCHSGSRLLELERVSIPASASYPNFKLSIFNIPNRIKSRLSVGT